MHLNSSNAAGPDERQHRLIRASNGIIPILTTILQNSLDIQGIHYNWKTSHVVSIYIYIKGTKYNSENYKPIYLTCIYCKLLEHIVVSSIMTHANAYNILFPSSMMGFENKDHVKPN